MDNFRVLLDIRMMARVPNAQIRISDEEGGQKD